MCENGRARRQVIKRDRPGQVICHTHQHSTKVFTQVSFLLSVRGLNPPLKMRGGMGAETDRQTDRQTEGEIVFVAACLTGAEDPAEC
jgi:hypothetical protein